MSFTNKSIIEPRPGKPHICKRGKWWRVSAANWDNLMAYHQAHEFVARLNNRRPKNGTFY